MSFGLVKYLKELASKKDDDTLKIKPSMRVLIEGGDYQGWYHSQLDMMFHYIPKYVTRLNVDDVYHFDLVGIIKPDGTLEERTINPEQSKVMNLEYSILLGIPRPTTAITEDGRIFHDMSLMNDNLKINNQRLKLFLKSIVEKYGRKESFERAYKRLTAEKS